MTAKPNIAFQVVAFDRRIHNPVWARQRALQFIANGDWESAEKCILAAMESSPENASNYVFLATIYEATDQHELAKQMLSRAEACAEGQESLVVAIELELSTTYQNATVPSARRKNDIPPGYRSQQSTRPFAPVTH